MTDFHHLSALFATSLISWISKHLTIYSTEGVIGAGVKVIPTVGVGVGVKLGVTCKVGVTVGVGVGVGVAVGTIVDVGVGVVVTTGSGVMVGVTSKVIFTGSFTARAIQLNLTS